MLFDNDGYDADDSVDNDATSDYGDTGGNHALVYDYDDCDDNSDSDDYVTDDFNDHDTGGNYNIDDTSAYDMI